MTYDPGYKSVGFRDAIAIVMENGLPAATSVSAPYVGFKLSGPKVFTLNIPNSRTIVHEGRDGVEATDQLPSKEAATGEIRVSGINLDTDAALSGVKKATFGNSSFISRMTDKQGAEPMVGVIAWQQSLLAGVRKWHIYTVPSARAIAIGAGMEDNPVDHRYSLNINPVDKHIWGALLTENVEGALSQGYADMYATVRPDYPLVSFKTDGSEDTFVFTAYKTGLTTYPVLVNGVLQSTGVTKGDGTLTFDYPPAAGILSIWLA
jgi:hypothetical protein